MIHDIASDLAALTYVDYDSVQVMPDSNPFEVCLLISVSDQVHDFHATKAFSDICERAVHIAQSHGMTMRGATWDVKFRDVSLTFDA